MKLPQLLFCLATACAFAFGADLEVDGGFTQQSKGKLTKWTLHEWDGYRPYAAMSVLPGADNGKNVVKIENVTCKGGGALRTVERFKGIAGDSLRVAFRARGKGEISVLLYYYTAKGEWNQTSSPVKFKLGKDWGDYIVPLYIENGLRAETASFNVCFGYPQYTALELSSVNVKHEPAKYRGSLPFPRNWQVFAPVDPLFEPAPESLLQMPRTFDGAKAVDAPLTANTIDFAPFVGGKGKEKCGWAFATITSPVECDYTIGAGADWWMVYYVNGEKVIDTSKTGNMHSPVTIQNYVKTIRLKKGKNIIAVKLITGAASSVLVMGGPADLRGIITKIKLTKIAWIDAFEANRTECTGNPELIQGYPTPGLLTMTGQAVFKTNSQVSIKAPVTQRELPDEDEIYLATSIRIQNFGRDENRRQDSTLAFVYTDGQEKFQINVRHQGKSGLLKIEAAGASGTLTSDEIPYRLLPADFIVAINRKGKYAIAINSLADSSSTYFRGEAPFLMGRKAAHVNLIFSANDRNNAEVVVDNFIIGTASDETLTSRTPFKVDLLKTFDPVKAGWKLAFNDEFDGKELDLKKWYFSPTSLPERLKLVDGKCVITADWNEKKTGVNSASIYTCQDFKYGYFEAKVKFRKEHGWWSAFWLCTTDCSNPFYDGFEIDIYEDYYLRPIQPGGEPRDILDHNLHIFAGSILKSWNYNSHLPGSIDDFYVIGCKWTPFEISYYLNGKLIESTANHSPYNSVTFDPFNHAAGITPLQGILSGCCGKSGGDPKLGNFPESFYVDYVRIYEYPGAGDPEVKLISKDESPFMIPSGSTMTFEADVKPNPVTKSPIKQVYLFDSGFLLDCKNKPPYKFDVILSKEYYDTTDYVKPGRSGKRLEFGCALHAFSIFVQDEAGRVSYTKPILKFIKPNVQSTPYLGKAQVIPGKVMLPFYDEGGQNVAYYDSTDENSADKSGKFRPGEKVDATPSVIGGLSPWEWMNYTVDIAREGSYNATLRYGTPLPGKKGFMLMLDGVPIGTFQVKKHESSHFGADTDSILSGLKLPAGQHTITLLAYSGGINLSHITFEEE